jgi:dipeptidyl aminopeptidase/acylaminoacyl peptidase
MNAKFSGDSRHLVFFRSGKLCLLELATGQEKQVPGVASMRMPYYDGRWCCYQLQGSLEEFVLLDLFSGREQHFNAVRGYWLEDYGRAIVIKNGNGGDSAAGQSLRWLNLADGSIQTILSTPVSSDKLSLDGCTFDGTGSQLLFVSEQKMGEGKIIWYYKSGMAAAVPRVASPLSVNGQHLALKSNPKFSSNDHWIIFGLSATAVPLLSADAIKINIWSYRDPVLQPEQRRRLENAIPAKAAVSVEGGSITQLASGSEYIQAAVGAGDYWIVSDPPLAPWFKPQSSFYLVSAKDGSRRLLRKEYFGLTNFCFSPEGKWLVYYDKGDGAYYSYDIAKGVSKNITGAIPTAFRNEYGSDIVHDAVAPVAGWLPGDTGVLLYDNYDIWQVDLSGQSPAINVTHGYGKRRRLKLRLCDNRGHGIIYQTRDTLLLTAFSPINKYNGFCRQVLGDNKEPEELCLGPYTFYRVPSQKAHYITFNDGMAPVKAKEVNVWVIMRQTASEAPNYYLTEDFKTFKSLTDEQPQQGYNWLSSELVSWSLPDGRHSQGVLYKPEDFDPHKKYPLLFNYYEQLSHRLYEYPLPGFTEGDINIPWFVSQGYLVFTPDIHYRSGKTSGKTFGEWAYESVESAARYLSNRSYVDGKRMGLQGHSFGGGETNYIITRSHMFAAAAEVAGDSDPMSAYLTLVPFGATYENSDKQWLMETSHEQYGASPWERPDLYLKSSPVLNADKVRTPLLIVHNEKDNNIQWRQGIELYMALRRLGKKCWMLQYDEAGHILFGRDAEDYTIRLTQFFNYYLKGALPPVWMTRGVPFVLKGLDKGYELDASGLKP